MVKVIIRHSKKMTELELKRAVNTLKQADPEESLKERIQQLKQFEKKFGMSSIAFYQKYCMGKLGDQVETMRWAAAYEAYLFLMQAYFLPHTKAK